MIEVYQNPPPGSFDQLEVAACYVECNKKILLLQLSEHKSEAGKWGVPAGKKEKEETIQQTAQRELYEETGIALPASFELEPFGLLYLRKPDIDYMYHMFYASFLHYPLVQLSAEHQNYCWASIQEIDALPLMAGAKQALEHWVHLQKV